MQSEFRNRQPPPTYNAAMNAARQSTATDGQRNRAVSGQLTAQQIVNTQPSGSQTNGCDCPITGCVPGCQVDNYSLPSSPPPTYRSQASQSRPGIRITFPPTESDESRPPTYR